MRWEKRVTAVGESPPARVISEVYRCGVCGTAQVRVIACEPLKKAG
jgi:hypothetical protein